MPPIKFQLILTHGLEGNMVWISRWPPRPPSWILEHNDFSNSEFHQSPMPPIKFKLNQTYRSRADVIWRCSRWLPWWPSWISERNHFSNSKFPCPYAFHPVSAPSDLWFGSRQQLNTFKMAALVVIMDKILMEMSQMWKVTGGHMG